MDVKQDIKSITLEAKVIRADGTVEDLGKVAEYQSNPRKQSKLLDAIHIINPSLYQRYLRSV
jgi:hypothetical protein